MTSKLILCLAIATAQMANAAGLESPGNSYLKPFVDAARSASDLEQLAETTDFNFRTKRDRDYFKSQMRSAHGMPKVSLTNGHVMATLDQFKLDVAVVDIEKQIFLLNGKRYVYNPHLPLINLVNEVSKFLSRTTAMNSWKSNLFLPNADANPLIAEGILWTLSLTGVITLGAAETAYEVSKATPCDEVFAKIKDVLKVNSARVDQFTCETDVYPHQFTSAMKLTIDTKSRFIVFSPRGDGDNSGGNPTEFDYYGRDTEKAGDPEVHYKYDEHEKLVEIVKRSDFGQISGFPPGSGYKKQTKITPDKPEFSATKQDSVGILIAQLLRHGWACNHCKKELKDAFPAPPKTPDRSDATTAVQ